MILFSLNAFTERNEDSSKASKSDCFSSPVTSFLHHSDCRLKKLFCLGLHTLTLIYLCQVYAKLTFLDCIITLAVNGEKFPAASYCFCVMSLINLKKRGLFCGSLVSVLRACVCVASANVMITVIQSLCKPTSARDSCK